MSLAEGLFGVYLISLALIGYRFEGNFAYNQLWWLKSNGCMTLSVISSVSITVSPLFGLCYYILLQRMLLATSPTYFKPSRKLVVVLCSIWCVHVTAISVASYKGQELDRYCFVIMPREPGHAHFEIVLAALYHLVCFTVNVIFYIQKCIQIKSSKEQFKRKDFTKDERNYLRNTVINIVASFPSVALLVVLAGMHSKLNFAPAVKEIVILFGFSYHPVYRAVKTSIANIKATILGN